MFQQTKTIIILSPNKIQEVRTYVCWAELRLQWAALLCLVSTVVCQPSAMATLALASLCTCKGKKRSEKKYVCIYSSSIFITYRLFLMRSIHFFIDLMKDCCLFFYVFCTSIASVTKQRAKLMNKRQRIVTFWFHWRNNAVSIS